MRGNGFTKGLITGTIIGASVSMMVNPMEGQDRKFFKKKTKSFFRTIGGVIDGFTNMIR